MQGLQHVSYKTLERERTAEDIVAQKLPQRVHLQYQLIGMLSLQAAMHVQSGSNAAHATRRGHARIKRPETSKRQAP